MLTSVPVSEKKPKLGRPRRAGAVADERITIRVTPAELRAWRAKAGDAELGAWVRETCNRKAGSP